MYILKTPNKQYNGVTEGVAFSKGIGQTDNSNIRNILVNDYGYVDVTPELKKEKEIDEMTVPELKEKAKSLDLEGFSNLKRDELVALIKGEPNAEEDNNTNDEPAAENDNPEEG